VKYLVEKACKCKVECDNVKCDNVICGNVWHIEYGKINCDNVESNMVRSNNNTMGR